MLKLTTPSQINDYFARWHEFTESERLQTIRDLKIKGKLSIVPSSLQVDFDFKCPMNGFVVARPCNLSSCQYYIGPKRISAEGKKRSPKVEIVEAQQTAAAECKNCLINCLDKSKNGRLSAQEVATIMGISVSEVNSINNNAIAKIRRATVKELIEKLQLPRFKYLTGSCVACGMNIQDELEMSAQPELLIVASEYGWCSEGCRDDKPKWQFTLERQFECDYLDIFGVGLSINSNFETLGNIFGVNNDLLKEHEKDIRKRHAHHQTL